MLTQLRYQEERIFLAGDSVYMMFLFRGFRATIGIANAYNLVQKLALVLKSML
jgi:2-polyprenyl-6-methoxyphenol hydroxylase-like FAD-dependent oxidoreductase